MRRPYYISLISISLNGRFSLKNVFSYLENHCIIQTNLKSSPFFVGKSLQSMYVRYLAIPVLAKRSHCPIKYHNEITK